MTSILSTTSSLRIGGLASGIDTDSIIKELMKAQRIPLDRLNQDKQILLWQQEDYRAIYDSLRAFRDKVFNMKLQATYQARKASSSNEAAVSASANSNAVPGMYTLTVKQLATGVSKGSQAALPEETEGGLTKTLKAQFNLSYDNLTFTLEGANGKKDFSFNTNTANIYTVAAEINAANLGITASYDATLNRFFLTTTSTGTAAKIKVTNDVHYFLSGDKDANGGVGDPALESGNNTLKLLLKGDGTAYTGQDAEFDFGDATGLKSATNTITINGITLTLKQGGGASATITVFNDTDAVFNAIKDFVSAYNEIIDKINGKLTEPRYRDYLPLTDEQREQLSDEQEKKWEEKARSGLLRGDSLLESVVSRIRATMSAIVPGLAARYDTLADVGITTLSYEERGKLYIDEAKLKEALQKDPDGVMNLFTRSSENYAEKGIAMRLYDDVNSAMALISARAGTSSSYSTADNSAIGRQIAAMNERISTLEERLQQMEDRYWRQFTAMEQAIQQMNAQSAWLAQQLGMGQGR
ncbi:flagellar filament capping protein FliD [Desulfofundulus thermosubterraneus]|uniref:Flagellar hook-associated protein 2 n=1 Tax=Desulfofundulus thermosubterraneus DSM 16057 TaxID=1121432 RepID=A0A1M6K1K6_9FIRM|nr:flagellar filament capping protein FliD [Desulfofundulus thermosubterraneus]SHJ52856.1 flagellar hook-associated protein 2 [Desulfofundulus thermosubterraneus DSM 16057]